MYPTNDSPLYAATVDPRTPAAVPEMELARGQLDNLVAELTENVRGLEVRLQTVLLPPVPRPTGNNDTKDVIHSPAVAHLRGMAYTLQAVIEIVNDIKSRLEV